MATKIVTKNSSTASAVPTASDLVQGELAVNVVDKRLFTENNAGAVVELGTNPSTIDINAGTIDGAVIGGTTPAAITGSTVTSTGNIVVTGTVDGRDVAADGTKLDGIEAGATADQTAAEIKTAYESNADTNAFTDADHTKLDGIEASADVTDTANVTAAGALMDSELTSEASVKALNQGVATGDSPTFAGLTVDTDTLYVDSTNNRVGIGTTSPTEKLHLNGTALMFGARMSSNNGSTYWDVKRDISTGHFHIADDSLGNVLTIRQDSGNVGIGTSSPSAPLDVDGSGTGIDLANFGGSAQTNFSKVNFNTDALSSQAYIIAYGSGNAESGNVAIKNTNSSGDIFFTAGNAERMRIDSSGKVGIGTTTVGQFSSTDVGLTVDSGNAYSGIAMTDGATTSTLVQGYSTTYLYNQANGSMLFGTNNTERMRINSSGNLGIGITSPTADLHVRRAADGTESNAHFKIAGGASTYTAHHWLDSTAYYIGQSATSRRVRIYSGAEASGVNLNAGATSWGTFSDERLKYDVEPVENAVESLSNLRTVKYRLKDVDSAEDKKKIGLMAQDLVGVLDEVIDPVKKTGDDTEYMSVRYTELVPVLVKAIQEQQTLIESLTARIAALEE